MRLLGPLFVLCFYPHDYETKPYAENSEIKIHEESDVLKMLYFQISYYMWEVLVYKIVQLYFAYSSILVTCLPFLFPPLECKFILKNIQLHCFHIVQYLHHKVGGCLSKVSDLSISKAK